MKRLILSFFVALVLSVGLASFTDIFCFSSGTISTFYTVSGIMFSIGMGLLVTTDISKVKHKRLNSSLQEVYSTLQRDYLVYFFTISLLYTCSIGFIDSKEPIEYAFWRMVFRLNEFIGFMMLLSIWYFTTNFLGIQRLTKEINQHLNS